MDDAEADDRWSAGREVNQNNKMVEARSHGRVGGRGTRAEATGGASLRAIVWPSADLGGSSDESVENTEDWSGVGFHVNSTWTWGSRS